MLHRLDIQAETMRDAIGWVGLAIYVWLYDWLVPKHFNRPTLSRSLWEALEHPKKRWFVLFAWGWTTSHLLLKRPAKILLKW